MSTAALISMLVISMGVAGTALLFVVNSIAQYSTLSVWKILSVASLAALAFVAWKLLTKPS